MTDETEPSETEEEQLRSELARVRMQLIGAIAECRETARVLGALDIETSVTAADRVMAHVAKIESALKTLVEHVDVTPAKKFEALVHRLRDIGELPSVLASARPYRDRDSEDTQPFTLDVPLGDPALWRVGRSIRRNIYRGDEPIAMVATPELAAEIVVGMNFYESRAAR
jgi:hypothetical protein